MDGSALPPYASSSSSSNISSSPVSTLRNDGLPPYGSTNMLRLPSDDELLSEGVEGLIQRLRVSESEYKKLLVDRGKFMKDVNRKTQSHLAEMRNMRDVNQRLLQEKECLISEKDELSGMCCFLDDDREKAKKMAREWQVFGRYATGVLSKELSHCHSKIRDLEQKQKTLSTENKNLKELCLLLDQQQAGSRTSVDSQESLQGPTLGLLGVAGTRDSGDGSSNGSTASNYSPDHKSATPSGVIKESNTENRETYIRYLENKVRYLEDEMKGRAKKVSTVPSLQGVSNHNMSPSKTDRRIYSPMTHHSSNSSLTSSTMSPLSNSSFSVNGPIGNPIHVPNLRISGGDATMNVPHPASSKQEQIAYGRKVLELQDQMESSLPNSMYPGAPTEGSHLDEQHKEIVREMCNVVWQKLGGSRTNLRRAPPSRTLQHRSASVSNL